MKDEPIFTRSFSYLVLPSRFIAKDAPHLDFEGIKGDHSIYIPPPDPIEHFLHPSLTITLGLYDTVKTLSHFLLGLSRSY